MGNQKNLPEKKFRAGAVSVTVWNNSSKGKLGEPIEYKTVSLERRYKNNNGEWQSTNSFRLNDIPKAIVALSSVYEYLVMKPENNAVVEEEVR